MKLTSYQRKKIADKVVEHYADKIGVEIGFFITPSEREKLSMFAMRLLELRGNKFSVEHVRNLFWRKVKTCNAVICLCASLICRDVLDCDIIL